MAAVRHAPDVFSLGEIARAADTSPSAVRALVDAGTLTLLPSGFVGQAEARGAVKLLRGGSVIPVRPQLFGPAPSTRMQAGLPLLASGVMHAAVLVVLVLATTLGLATPTISKPLEFNPVRLVFLAMPGPGGGGGGGGLKQAAPPAKAKLDGTSALRSPVPPRAVRSEKPRVEPPRPAPPPELRPVERPAQPPPPVPHIDPSPPVLAPVVPVAADPADKSGALSESAGDAGSRGSGEGGGSGTGAGTGIGEGTGPGIGPGSGGGTGGGPYRPGAGITPPGLLREVRPDYTEEARRRNLEGEVLLEIVVRSDGTVGKLKILQGLGGGLDQRAVEAVRQWRFSPARRHGSPVDVLVEVAVEFRLR